MKESSVSRGDIADMTFYRKIEDLLTKAEDFYQSAR